MKIKIKWFFLLILVIFVTILQTVPGNTKNPDWIGISGEKTHSISPFAYGQNYWSWVMPNGISGTEKTIRELAPNILRFGGYCNDAQDPKIITKFDVDNYIKYCRVVGAEPIFQVPVLKGDAVQAAEWVRYCNIEKGYGIKYWSVGNEPDLYENEKYKVDQYIKVFNAYALAMKKVDPTILIMGPDTTINKYNWNNDRWLTPFLKACKDNCDILSFHRYPFDRSECTVSNALHDGAKLRAIIRKYRQLAAKYNKPVAITEANICWEAKPNGLPDPPAFDGTFFAGMWVADTLGVSLEEGLWSLDFWGISEDYWPKVGFLTYPEMKPRPPYYALQLFTKHFGTEVLIVSHIPNDLSVYASKDSINQKVVLIVINKSSKSALYQFKCSNLPFTVTNQSFEFGPYSITCLTFYSNGESERLVYNQELAEQGSPPQ